MCTGIFIKTENNEYIVGRTLEFGIPINFSQICNDFLFATKGHFIGSKNEYIFDGLNKYGLVENYRCFQVLQASWFRF